MILSIISVRKDKEINTISMHNGYGHTGYWIGSTLCDDEVLVLHVAIVLILVIGI
jgi:hypothetical protein